MDPLGAVWTGERRGAGVALRLLGTRPQVEEMDTRGRESVADWVGEGRKVEVLGREESRRFFRGVSSWEGDSDLVLRLSLLPTKADALLARGRTLAEGLCRLVGGEARMALHLGWGVLRLTISGSEPTGSGLEPVVKVLSELRGELEGEGGSLVLSHGPALLIRELGSFGHMGGEGEIMAGLKREFDPQGILPWHGLGG